MYYASVCIEYIRNLGWGGDIVPERIRLCVCTTVSVSFYSSCYCNDQSSASSNQFCAGVITSIYDSSCLY